MSCSQYTILADQAITQAIILSLIAGQWMLHLGRVTPTQTDRWDKSDTERWSSAAGEKSSDSFQLIPTLDTTVKLDEAWAHTLRLQTRLNPLIPDFNSELSVHKKTQILLYTHTHTRVHNQQCWTNYWPAHGEWIFSPQRTQMWKTKQKQVGMLWVFWLNMAAECWSFCLRSKKSRSCLSGVHISGAVNLGRGSGEIWGGGCTFRDFLFKPSPGHAEFSSV